MPMLSLTHDDKDLSKMVDGPDGKKQINPKYTQHLGRTPKPNELEGVRKDLSKNRFADMLNKLKQHKGGGDDKGFGDKPGPEKPEHEKGGFSGDHDKDKPEHDDKPFGRHDKPEHDKGGFGDKKEWVSLASLVRPY